MNHSRHLWGQGRTAFGGISAAVCFQAAQNLIVDQRTPRSFHCNFIGPVTCGEPLKVTAEILRTGKNVTQIVASVLQNDRVCVMAQICFGISRGSILHKPDTTKHALTVPKKVTSYLKFQSLFLSLYNILNSRWRRAVYP
ncbi:acyl-CoA thioesterase [Psychrosphaera algicola]|uniref:acyl-CoA thioesterase n=1 Tax=Psychrosphaera algicola TaxID=3023714 RepID=UPI00351D6C57